MKQRCELTFSVFRTKVASTPRGVLVRPGQHAFNMLCLHNPEIANRIRGRINIDPFYEDSNLPAFWRDVAGMWGNV